MMCKDFLEERGFEVLESHNLNYEQISEYGLPYTYDYEGHKVVSERDFSFWIEEQIKDDRVGLIKITNHSCAIKEYPNRVTQLITDKKCLLDDYFLVEITEYIDEHNVKILTSSGEEVVDPDRLSRIL